MMRIDFDELQATFQRILLNEGASADVAARVARVFAENSRDGIYSHGLNRFPSFIDYVRRGLVDLEAKPVLVNTIGAVERWDGQLGPGILNASFCIHRAIALASKFGIGCVALRNTNHWMRGGTYGLMAAEAGYIAICFTNTIANLPPWGGTTPRLGNNPLVIAAPHQDGPVLLDMAMTQYAYGKLLNYQAEGKDLPYEGGFDTEGCLTKDPAAIVQSQRPLPIGLWKGAGLSFVLDILAAVLSDGKATASISEAEIESGVSQVFICIRNDDERRDEIIRSIIAFTNTSVPESDDTYITYPGENMLHTRELNLRDGVPVNPEIWETVKNL